MRKLGLIALGDKHRPDFDRAMHDMFPGVPYLISGALDGCSRSDLAGMADRTGAYPLRVPALGEMWEIPRDRLLSRLADAHNRLRDDGAGLTILMCAGEFPVLPVSSTVFYPGKVVPAVVRSLLDGGTRPPRIGIILPNEGQVPFAEKHWTSQGFATSASWAEPGNSEQLTRAVKELGGEIDSAVLDCMGFGGQCMGEARRALSVPVISALHVSLRVACAML